MVGKSKNQLTIAGQESSPKPPSQQWGLNSWHPLISVPYTRGPVQITCTHLSACECVDVKGNKDPWEDDYE